MGAFDAPCPPPTSWRNGFLRQGGGRRVAAHPVPSLATAPVCPACPGAVFSATGYRAEKPPREGLGQGLPRVGSKAQRPKTRFPVSSGQRLDLQVGITGSAYVCSSFYSWRPTRSSKLHGNRLLLLWSPRSSWSLRTRGHGHGNSDVRDGLQRYFGHSIYTNDSDSLGVASDFLGAARTYYKRVCAAHGVSAAKTGCTFSGGSLLFWHSLQSRYFQSRNSLQEDPLVA